MVKISPSIFVDFPPPAPGLIRPFCIISFCIIEISRGGAAVLECFNSNAFVHPATLKF